MQTLIEPRLNKTALTQTAVASPETAVAVHKMKRLDRVLESWRIRIVAKYLNYGDEVLDIGCGNGEIFRQLSWLGSSVGIDPELTDENLPAIPHTQFFSGMFPEALPEPRQF